jgi:hypothetical protein
MIKLDLVSMGFVLLAISLSKTSFIVVLLRIFELRRLQSLLWFLLVTINVAFFVNSIYRLLECRPMNSIWDPIEGECWSDEAHLIFGTAVGGK